MSIPKGRSSYFGRYTDPEKFRLINQEGVRIIADPGKINYPHCWGMNVSPYDGMLYVSLANEGIAGQHTRLMAYDFAKNEEKIVLKIEEAVLPKERMLPQSKLHESIDFLPDGRVIAATHSTGRPNHHNEWMPFAHINHVYDGFPGSSIIIYYPKTGETKNLGIPVPRESIYGACYESKYNCYYFIGFMRGHVYRYSLDNCSVKDLGKAAEVYCYRMHLGPDGNIYCMTKTGFLFRINVDTQKLEDLNWRLPAYPDNFVNNTWYRYLSQACNCSDHEFVFTSTSSEDIYLFDTHTLKVESLGKRSPVDYVNDFSPDPLSLDEIAIDKYGVLWYALSGFKFDLPEDEFFYAPNQYRIFHRWDFKAGKRPEILGLMGSQEQNYSGSYVMCIDKERDIFYCMGSATPIQKDPTETYKSASALFCIDLAKFRPNAEIKGPVWEQPIVVKPYSEEAVAETKRKLSLNLKLYAGEEVSGNNPFVPVSIGNVIPIRLWRHTPDICDSSVIGIAWDDEMNVHGLCGTAPLGAYGDFLDWPNTESAFVEAEKREKVYYFKIIPREKIYFDSKEAADADENVMVWRCILKSRMVEREENNKWAVYTPFSFSYAVGEVKPFSEISAELRDWLKAKLQPGSVQFPEGIKLPEVTGRRYLAVSSATVEMSCGQMAVGTRDGLFATYKNGKVFSYGNAASHGPVRCLCVTPDRKKVYGTAGDVEDLNTIFTFDEETGLHQLGFVNYNSPGWMDGPTAANILSSIAVSPDGRYLAVGGADRLGSVHIIKLGEGES
ncbi:MAG: hypothetical protein FWF15_00610 [Oscillospiraceae bacterium]|nr:hypothetical protein [Oscillospiraceae bacterium]